MMITRTPLSTPNSVMSSPVTVLTVNPLDKESKDRLLDRCEPLELQQDCTHCSAWELPRLQQGEESNHLVQNVLNDLQRAQEFGSISQASEAWNALGLIRLHTRRNPLGALECHEKALRLLSSSSSSCDKNYMKAVTLSDIGLCYERLHQPKEAVLAYQQAMDLMKGTSHPRMVSLERTMARLSRT